MTTGFCANFCSACEDSARRVFSAVARRRLTAPSANASPSGLATVVSAFALGRSRRMNSVLFSVNGASKGSE